MIFVHEIWVGKSYTHTVAYNAQSQIRDHNAGGDGEK